MNSGLITSDMFRKHLLKKYIGEGGEDSGKGMKLNSLYSSIEGPPMIEIDDDDDEDHEKVMGDGKEKPPNRVLLTSHKPPGAIVYQLFGYFQPSFINKLTHHCSDIIRSLRERCDLPTLVAHVEKQESKINLIMRTLNQRMVLEILTVDSSGEKIKEILSRHEELYLLTSPGDRAIIGCKSNMKMMDETYRLLEATERISRQPEKDDLYITLSGTKRRGRRPHSESEKKPNRVDAIKADFILSRKSTPPVVYDERDGKYYVDLDRVSNNSNTSNTTTTTTTTTTIRQAGGGGGNIQYPVDHYPVYRQVSTIFCACIPTNQNHGAYQSRARQGVRILTSSQWPMRGLFLSLMNMEALIRRSEIVIEKSEKPYYCAYTGERLIEGEKVWHLIILVNDGERYEKWTKRSMKPAEANTSPEYTRSLKAYFIKTKVISQCSLFYSPMDPEYRRMCEQAAHNPTTGTMKLIKPTPYILPLNRKVSVNTLWYSLCLLRSLLSREKLESSDSLHFSDGITGKRKFLQVMTESRELIQLFSHCSNDDTLISIKALIHCITIPWSQNTSLEDPRVADYIDKVLDTLLDFVELLFPYTSICRIEPLPLPMERRVIIMEHLGLPFAPSSGQKNSPAEAIRTIKPILERFSSLGKLLYLCERRRDKRESDEMNVDEEKERNIRLQLVMKKHPALFLSFFYNIFTIQHDATQQLPSLSVMLDFMRKLGILLDTSSL